MSANGFDEYAKKIVASDNYDQAYKLVQEIYQKGRDVQQSKSGAAIAQLEKQVAEYKEKAK